MTEWFRDHWPDEDVWSYYEVDDEGFVRRAVELEGPHRDANTACSLEEWEDAYRTGTTDEYDETYGMPDDWSLHGLNHHDLEPSTETEFEGVWRYARKACEAGSRSRPEPNS
jgi:hypothetical protein